jgi:methanogenic corrinoid protein MtbC1
MASAIVEAATAAMLRLVSREDAERTAVVACFADDTHTMPILGFALQMATWGYDVVRLGARTPPPAIRQAVEELEPVLVGLSVTITPVGHRARELVDEYAAACGDTPWVVGGSAAPDLAELVVQRGGVVLEGFEPRPLHNAIEALVAKSRKRRPPAARTNGP